MSREKNIFVIGMDEFNRQFLSNLSNIKEYKFHDLLTKQEIVDSPFFDIPLLFKKINQQLQNFTGSIDAIVSYWDFPSVLMLPILREQYGLTGPSFASVLKCEHKYLSRLEQAKIIPEHIPAFSVFHPEDEQALSKINLSFPFWIKPVTAHSSLFGFKVRSADEFKRYCTQIQQGIKKFSEPMDKLLKLTELPEEIANMNGGYFIAEEMISKGKQCTLEGYALNGDVVIYGIIDSIRGPNRSSLVRYEYPSQLPKSIQEKMKFIAEKVVRQIGLNQSPFNIEFFYDKSNDQIRFLEINARISKSHCALFEKVEGVPNSVVMVDVALGRHPTVPKNKGKYQHAAKFMPRVYHVDDDLYALKAPDPQTIQRIKQIFEGAEIELHVQTNRAV